VRGVAVVTGAGRGLGAAIAHEFRLAGYEVFATDISGTDVVLDVTDAEACRRFAAETDPVVWVNNAAVLGPGRAAEQPDALLHRVVETNLLGTIHGTRAAVAVMRRRAGGRGEGRIINVGSIGSWFPVPGEAVYGATKAAVLSFTLALQVELRQQGIGSIRLSVLCPDGMLTPMVTEELHNPAAALSFSGLRPLDPQRVARQAVALVDRPRPIRSVPRWRGAAVRVAGAVPDRTLWLAPLFTRIGERNRRGLGGRS
jgi:NAD(P)-dependent dehydrogenase (short-subunit alcohol dehydrogenase family)